jgi:HSP20 family protein
MALSFDPFTEFDRLTAGLVPQRASQRFMPVDLYRDGDEYVLSADLPGVDPGSVDIDIDGQLLTIRAQRTTASGTEGTKWLAQERPSGSYLRQFTLGDGLDTERISANYDNGVLSVIIPVSERAKPRKVAVESRSEQTSISA